MFFFAQVDPYDVGGRPGSSGGTMNQHAVWRGVRYTAEHGNSSRGLHVDSLDAAMACPLVYARDAQGRAMGEPGAGASGSNWACDGWSGPLNRSSEAGLNSHGVGGMGLQLHWNRCEKQNLAPPAMSMLFRCCYVSTLI
jgi:hypothetical protein